MELLDILTKEEKQLIDRMINGPGFRYEHIAYTNTGLANVMLSRAVNLMRTNYNAKIAVFFDIDFDGIASGYIMWTMLKEASLCDPTRIIPIINRIREHGITLNTIDYINSDPNIVLTIIVDSSTNNQDTFEKLNCDCLIIDHHDVETNVTHGNTNGGEFVIINNNLDSIKNKSATEVVYEYWYSLMPDLLQSLQLEDWVAISLYSDVIYSYTEQNLWFISHLYNIRPNADIRKIIEPLNILTMRNGKPCLTAESISYQLVPLVNSCMRMQCGPELVDTILYRPNKIIDFRIYKTKQKEIVDALMQIAIVECRGDMVLAQLRTSTPKRATSALDIINAAKQKQALSVVNQEMLRGFNGLIASKLLEKYNATAFVYIGIGDTLKGSVRVHEQYAKTGLRTELNNKAGWTASGHSDAFGFTYDLTIGTKDNLITDVRNAFANVGQVELHQSKYVLADYNFLYNLVNSQREETEISILKIAELNNIKIGSDRYTFIFTIGAGFEMPVIFHPTSYKTEYIYEGRGRLRIKLVSYNDSFEFIPGETYEVTLQGTDVTTVHGSITKLENNNA